jgi:hypothetical protein
LVTSALPMDEIASSSPIHSVLNDLKHGHAVSYKFLLFVRYDVYVYVYLVQKVVGRQDYDYIK